ncbi:MAG: aspartyl/asparaginyl beta-hydroxylase domain-containing protein [Sphingomonadaceae bacterium]|nr:aspartyl/asparaginyl beta-hydroxylase domain-containing protein [Sphingomonadaceae bacterium]
MRHFLQIAGGIDVMPILAALAARPEMWNQHNLRTTYPGSPHADADDILLMFNELDGDVVDDIQTHPFDAWYQLPVRALVLDLMHRVGGVQLGRVMITRLAPGKQIAPHVDQGAPAEFYSRYMVALQSGPGCVTKSGDEVVTMRSGEAWWFDNRAEHAVLNNSGDDRITLIADMRLC